MSVAPENCDCSGKWVTRHDAMVYRCNPASGAFRGTKLKAIVNLADGGFVLKPNPSKMRLRKRILGLVVLFFAGVLVVLEGQGIVKFHRIYWDELLVPSVAIVLGAVLCWYVIRLPSLKGDAMQVSVLDGLDTKRMSRSDLGFIFRGQVLRQVRGGSFWDKSYIFAGPDGTTWLSPLAGSFIDAEVVEFAQRLQVPIRGDFSLRVSDRVDPTAH